MEGNKYIPFQMTSPVDHCQQVPSIGAIPFFIRIMIAAPRTPKKQTVAKVQCQTLRLHTPSHVINVLAADPSVSNTFWESIWSKKM